MSACCFPTFGYAFSQGLNDQWLYCVLVVNQYIPDTGTYMLSHSISGDCNSQQYGCNQYNHQKMDTHLLNLRINVRTEFQLKSLRPCGFNSLGLHVYTVVIKNQFVVVVVS